MKAVQLPDGDWAWQDSDEKFVAAGFKSEAQARWWDDRRRDGAVLNKDREREEKQRGGLRSRKR